MDARFVVNLQGKDFILHEGLLDAFHKNGGKVLSTELVPTQDGIYLFKATAEGEKGIFTAHGDASPSNVNSMIAKHLIRMAETRAVNRALRFYNNIGMCSVDELGGDDSVKIAPKKPYAPPAHPAVQQAPGQIGDITCPKCGKPAQFRSGVSTRGPWEGVSCPCTKGIQFFRDKKKPPVKKISKEAVDLEVPPPPDFDPGIGPEDITY